MKLTGIIVSGYFNPLHKGHIELFHKAKEKGDILIVIINSDYQRALKGSKEFMLQDERLLIIKELKVVDEVVLSIDTDKTVCATIKKIHDNFSSQYKLFFANGGDQNNDSIPELNICRDLGIDLIEGLGDNVELVYDDEC